MAFPPVRKDMVGLLQDIMERLGLVERRLAKGSQPVAGTSAQRDARFGVPATDAQRVALANAMPLWVNTSTGWDERYYALDTLSGLTVPGLVAPSASGWYPVGRADFAFAAKRNGFQALGGANATTLIDGLVLVRERGSFTLVSNRLVVPRDGEYQVTIKTYMSGGAQYASVSVGCNLTGTAPDLNSDREFPSFLAVTPANGIDQSFSHTRAAMCRSGDPVGLATYVNAVTAGAVSVWGDSTTNSGWGTSIEMVYIGPPLAR